MKISLDWLSEYVDLQGLSVEQLSDLLTFAGVEVEEIEVSEIHDKVVVAEVVSKAQHPNADKLTVCQVNHGSGTSQIVCGAKNFNEGDRVPLALPGAVLPSGLKIKKGKLRGETSEGMLCSGQELGLASDVDGLMILSADAAPGTHLNSIYPPDTRVTVEVTPNRPDWLSHLGLAREVAAVTSIPLQKESVVTAADTPTREATADEIKLDADSACPFYTARIIRGVRVTESPAWLRQRLESVGLRPINNVVDITNFVLMDMGQPLHAFDLGKLQGGIHVRRARNQEQIKALDGEVYELGSEDTVIADSTSALAIAGVMGGEPSSVTEGTTDIFLESAYFDPPSVRRTSHRLALSSDSSYRFERGADPSQVAGASALATELILKLAGGTPDPELQVAGSAPTLVGIVDLDHSRCRRLLGVEIEDQQITDILQNLGLGLQSQKDDTTAWQIPSYRLDLLRPVDLIEEVARIFGLDRIPARNAGTNVLPREEDGSYDTMMRVKQRLVDLGFCETPTLSMVSTSQIADSIAMEQSDAVAIKNPLGSDYGILRTSLLSGLAGNELSSGLLNVARRNANLGAATGRLFEAGTVYSRDGERQMLALLMAGKAAETSWLEPKPESLTVHDLRGVIEALLPGQRVDLEIIDSDRLALAARIYAEDSNQRTLLGHFGQCSADVSREIGYDAVLVAEVSQTALSQAMGKKVYQPMSPYPAISRDVAMEIAAKTPCATVDGFFRNYKEPLLEGFGLFDVFADPTGEKLDKSKKSLAYSLTYRSHEKTLKASTVDKAHSKLLQALQDTLGVTLR